MSRLQQAWYQGGLWVWLLLPLTLLFAFISGLRRWLYRLNLKHSNHCDACVVVVGNISVGGNGKTPLVIYLSQWLAQQGYKPGVLSRGYGGRSSHYPLQLQAYTPTSESGDEPAFIFQHVNCPVVVDPKRARGADYLCELGCDVILCDDGLQHYGLGRDIEIAVVDGQRRLGNGHLLPMGPLREGPWRLKTVDLVVVNGGDAQALEPNNSSTKNAGWQEYLMQLQPQDLVNVQQPERQLPLTEINQPVVAAAAIGNPERFFQLLRSKGVNLKQCLSFADHHPFSPDDLPQERVLMTEKDAVKCVDFAHEQWWYLPVRAELSHEFEQAFEALLAARKK